jgi:hypothetical protein
MAKGQDPIPGPKTNTTEAGQLLEAAFAQLKEWSVGEGATQLFPNGLEAVKVELMAGGNGQQECRVALHITGTQKVGKTAQAIGQAEDDDFVPLFNAEGHKVIANIAMNDLEANAPEIRTKVQEILDGGDRTIDEAAIFPDVIRTSQPQTKPFHFVDIPLQKGGPLNPPLPAAPHVLTKIDEFTALLKNGNGSAQEKADAVSWLFHLFGDVHQPLHCIERTNELHPDGDRGGNSFKLKGKAKNLHSAWDSAVNVLEPGKDQEELVTEIMETHSREELEGDLTITDTEKWARASFKLAKKHAYSLVEDPDNPPKPSTAYLKNMQNIGRRQAALAGYRLADRLQEIFR